MSAYHTTRSNTGEMSSGGRSNEPLVRTMDASNAPLSEQFRAAAQEWVALDAAASLLEETKTAVLAKMKSAHGDIPDSHAERKVKSSPEWNDFIEKMVKAREAAALKKVYLEYLRMKFTEWNSENATRRAEMRL